MIRNKEYNNFRMMCLQNGLQPCSESKWEYLRAKVCRDRTVSRTPIYDFMKITP